MVEMRVAGAVHPDERVRTPEPGSPVEPSGSAEPPPEPVRSRTDAVDGGRGRAPAGPAPARAATAGPAPARAGTGGRGWVGPLCVLVIGSFMSVLDTSIVNIAIPRMQVDLSTATDDIEWVVTAYTLTLGVAVPTTGWWGLRLGLTRLYVVAMVGFAAGSALCGFAWDLPSMIVFRVLQALPGGILPAVALTLLYRIVPPPRIGAAMGIYGLSIVVAPAVGPTLGGALVQYVDWRLVFFINVPVGAIGTVLALLVFPRIRPTSWPRFDLGGFLTIAYGLFALLLAFAEGDDWGWTGYRILILFVSSALSLALFVVIELEVDNPLLDLRIFATPAYLLSLPLLGIGVTGLFSALYFLPQYLQGVQNLREMNSGLVLLPASLILVVFMPVTGRLHDRFGPRYLIMAGLGVMAYGSHLLAQLTPETPRWVIQEWLAVRNLGVGLSMMPIITTGVSSLPPALTAAGSAMNNVVQRVASSIAIAVLGSLDTSLGAQLMADRSDRVSLGAQALPALVEVTRQSPGGLVGPYAALVREITTRTYDNGFQIVAALSVAGAVLAAFTRSGAARPPS